MSMKKARLALVVCAELLAATSVSAMNGKTVIPVSSELYTIVDDLYHEAGKVPPNFARPWNADEMSTIVSSIDPTLLSETGRAALLYVRNELSNTGALVNEGEFSFDSSPSATVETFFHIPITASTEEAPGAYEWIYGYEERQPFLQIPLEFWYGQSFYMTSVLETREEYRAITSASSPGVADNHLNVLFDDPNIRLDLYFPFRALLSTGGDWWSFLMGRDKLSWGGGVSGNLMLSDYSDFYDFVWLSFFSHSFKMTNVYIVTDHFLPDGSDANFSGFIGHRFEMRFFERLKLAVNESVTFANLPPELPRDLNFLMVFHNWTDPTRFNSLLSIEIEYTPWRYFNLYGHVAMDEFTTGYEAERGGGGGPPIYGYLAGVKGAYPLGAGYLDGAFEWAQTSPWLYNRRAPPYFYNVRRYWSLVTDKMEFITKPFGYEYGPDVSLLYLTASYSVPGSYKAGMDVTRSLKGEKDAGSPWDPAPGDAPPTGVPEKKWIVGLNGSWQPLSYLEIGAGLNWSYTANPGHQEGERRSDLEIWAFVSVKL